MRILRLAFACLVLIALPSPLFARGASPYLPLDLEPEIERQIERVLILADEPLLTRPIAAATSPIMVPARRSATPSLTCAIGSATSALTYAPSSR